MTTRKRLFIVVDSEQGIDTTMLDDRLEVAQIIELLLRLGTTRWREQLKHMNLYDVSTYTFWLIQQVARLNGYAEALEWGHDHETAVKKSNDRVAAVRKAVGYSIDRNDVRF